MKATRIESFDDWKDYFEQWLDDIGYDRKLMKGFDLSVKFGDIPHQEIEFGHFKGHRKWERVIEIPDQRIRDYLLHIIVVQGDTEFASVEQQKTLYENAPSDFDRYALQRVNVEEMRHGWQMCYLLVKYFGRSGKIEAQKLLERRADNGSRILDAFNEPVRNWLDFFTYTDFVDRDGKYQLRMLSMSAFAPLARSMPPMLKEESFHLGTGQNGIKRILQAGRIPSWLIQKYINKWVPRAYDLFGTDHSSSAQWFYEWGLKGRYDEHESPSPPDLEALNEHNRRLYRQEVQKLLDQLNKLIPEDQPKLYAPDLRFNRRIGDYAFQPYSITGEKLSPEAYEKHLREVLPTEEDEQRFADLIKEPGWIVEKHLPRSAYEGHI